MPDIENLKKQAKQIVRWHREGRHTVAAMIRGTLPDCAGLTDGEIMAREFKLADGQRLVARREGFKSWAALVTHGERQMVADKPVPFPQTPVLRAAEPYVFVADFRRSLAYYVDVLGFRAALTYGDPPFFGMVVRDAAAICMRQVKRPVMDHSVGGELLSAAIAVSNARLMFLELEARGATIHRPLKREPWHGQGQGNFIVADPDGNLLEFGGCTD